MLSACRQSLQAFCIIGVLTFLWGMNMLSKREEERRNQLEVMALDELVPEDHLVRKIDQAIDFDFVYDLVKDHYSSDNGRPSMDPVVLIKLVLIQYLFGIRSMCQTIKEIETNVAYRWFIGYGFSEKIPHFPTFGKNYMRRFHDTDLFEQILYRILREAMKKALLTLLSRSSIQHMSKRTPIRKNLKRKSFE